MSVTLNLSNNNPTTGTVSIELQGDGCAFNLSASDSLTLNGTFGFTTVSISPYALTFNVPAGTAISGGIVLPISLTKTDDVPQIMINNISGTVPITYSTKRGQTPQTLSPGAWLHLDGYTGD